MVFILPVTEFRLPSGVLIKGSPHLVAGLSCISNVSLLISLHVFIVFFYMYLRGRIVVCIASTVLSRTSPSNTLLAFHFGFSLLAVIEI